MPANSMIQPMITALLILWPALWTLQAANLGHELAAVSPESSRGVF